MLYQGSLLTHHIRTLSADWTYSLELVIINLHGFVHAVNIGFYKPPRGQHIWFIKTDEFNINTQRTMIFLYVNTKFHKKGGC